MTVPSELPTDRPGSWTKTHDGEEAKVWRNGEGDMIVLTQSFNAVTDYWEVTDSTGKVVEKRSCGPFESYLDALEYVNTFLPQFGRDELPDDKAEVPDDEIVEVASLPAMSFDALGMAGFSGQMLSLVLSLVLGLVMVAHWEKADERGTV